MKMSQTSSIEVVKPFRDMWLPRKELAKKHNHDIYQFINISGRVAGKTMNFIQLMFYKGLNYPTHDIVVLRANSSQLKESVFKAFQKYCLDKLPLEIFSRIKFRASPPLQITLPAGNNIFFGGVGMGSKSGSNQSRGKETDKPISLLIVEETQEIFSGNSQGEELLKQSIATYMRFLDDKIGFVIYAGNRDRNVNGKFNIWVREKEKDKDFLIIESSYFDIYQFLNQATIRMIEQEKELNPNNYKYMYLGQPVGGDDLVYGAFTESVHVLPTKFKVDTSQIFQVYVGVDGSSTRDKTVFMPIFQFKNAKLVCKLGDMLYHDPKKNGIVRNNIMAQKYVKVWLKALIEKYALYNIKITFVIDGHNADLIENLEFELSPFNNLAFVKFTKKDLVDTSEKVNNAFTQELLFLTDEDWKEIISNHTISQYVLFNELQTVCWREDDPDKFNDLIPNDMTDAIRYPIAYHTTTPYQMRDFNMKGGN
jgi:phage terminase large subunit